MPLTRYWTDCRLHIKYSLKCLSKGNLRLKCFNAVALRDMKCVWNVTDENLYILQTTLHLNDEKDKQTLCSPINHSQGVLEWCINIYKYISAELIIKCSPVAAPFGSPGTIWILTERRDSCFVALGETQATVWQQHAACLAPLSSHEGLPNCTTYHLVFTVSFSLCRPVMCRRELSVVSTWSVTPRLPRYTVSQCTQQKDIKSPEWLPFPPPLQNVLMGSVMLLYTF